MAAFPDQGSILPLIQLSITPVILISGLGSLVISMTNRLGRIVDRTRTLAAAARTATGSERQNLELQIKIMFRRGKMMRQALTYVTTSMFVSGMLIMILLVSAIFEVQITGLILGVFILSILCMLLGLGAFIRDVFVSLRALHADVSRTLADIESE